MTIERLIDRTGSDLPPSELYTRIDFPEPPEDRPYVFINMVSTVDGKIVVGEIAGTAKGVGGPTDQLLFRRLQRACDGALIGSSTLRAGTVIYPPEKSRFVVTHTGNVPLDNRFFTDAPDRAFVLAPESLPEATRERLAQATNLIQVGPEMVDLKAALRVLRRERGIRRLLCEGGANMNAQLIQAGLADELFLTIAPKIKGGTNIPTIVAGTGFPIGQFAPLTLLSLYHDDDELYLRYRFSRETSAK